jgi:YHS domain-containing protein
MGWVIRLLILLLVVRLLWRLVAGVIQGMAPDPKRKTPVGLVRDPVCGTFVVPSRALMRARGSTVHYFCSEECLNKFEGR